MFRKPGRCGFFLQMTALFSPSGPADWQPEMCITQNPENIISTKLSRHEKMYNLLLKVNELVWVHSTKSSINARHKQYTTQK
jgi:hypothetical protein